MPGGERRDGDIGAAKWWWKWREEKRMDGWRRESVVYSNCELSVGLCVMRWRNMSRGIVGIVCHNVACGKYEGSSMMWWCYVLGGTTTCNNRNVDSINN